MCVAAGLWGMGWMMGSEMISGEVTRSSSWQLPFILHAFFSPHNLLKSIYDLDPGLYSLNLKVVQLLMTKM